MSTAKLLTIYKSSVATEARGKNCCYMSCWWGVSSGRHWILCLNDPHRGAGIVVPTVLPCPA